MAGSPTIPTRDAFGPTRVDDGISPNDPNYLSARHINLMLWQLAGAGIVIPRAYVRCTFSSGVLTIAESGETWKPNGGGTPPGINKVATGHWELEYAASYPNEAGDSVPTELRWGETIMQTDDVAFRSRCQINADKRTVELRVFDAAGALADPAGANQIVVRVY